MQDNATWGTTWTKRIRAHQPAPDGGSGDIHPSQDGHHSHFVPLWAKYFIPMTYTESSINPEYPVHAREILDYQPLPGVRRDPVAQEAAPVGGEFLRVRTRTRGYDE